VVSFQLSVKTTTGFRQLIPDALLQSSEYQTRQSRAGCARRNQFAQAASQSQFRIESQNAMGSRRIAVWPAGAGSGKRAGLCKRGLKIAQSVLFSDSLLPLNRYSVIWRFTQFLINIGTG
jgi:hypothetical protein